MFSNFFFFPFPPPRAKWDKVQNFVDQCRPLLAIWRMRFACWIPKATSTHSQYVALIAYPLQQRLHERAAVLRYTYIAGLVLLLAKIMLLRCQLEITSEEAVSSDDVTGVLTRDRLTMSRMWCHIPPPVCNQPSPQRILTRQHAL